MLVSQALTFVIIFNSHTSGFIQKSKTKPNQTLYVCRCMYRYHRDQDNPVNPKKKMLLIEVELQIQDFLDICKENVAMKPFVSQKDVKQRSK